MAALRLAALGRDHEGGGGHGHGHAHGGVGGGPRIRISPKKTLRKRPVKYNQARSGGQGVRSGGHWQESWVANNRLHDFRGTAGGGA